MKYVLSRLREPSTYAGLAAFLGVFGVSVPSGVVQNLALVGGGVAGLVAAFTADR